MKRAFTLTTLRGGLALPAALMVTLFAGCAQLPALDGTITPELEAAAYPDLVPLGPVLASAQSAGTDPLGLTTAIDGRVAALKARAARLRGSVLSGAEQQRLAKGLQ